MSGRIWPGALRCWPGCLAEIVEDPDFPENVGARAVVVGRATEEEFGELWGEEWCIKPSRPLTVWLDDDHTVAVIDGDDVAFHDRYLRPLTPPPASDTTQTDDTAPCEVEPAQPDRVSA